MGNIIVAVLAAALIVGIIVFAVTKIKRGKQTKCKKCKTRYNFDTDVSYEIIGTVSARNGTDKKAELRCKCSKCGEEKAFIKLFPSQRINGGDKVVNLNVENEIREYFKK